MSEVAQDPKSFQANVAPDRTQEMETFFRREGYCIVDEVLSETTCAELITASQTLLELQKEEERYVPLMRPDKLSGAYAAALRSQRLIHMAELLLKSRIEAVQMTLMWHPPGNLGFDLHQDNYHLRSEPDAFVTAWVALEDAGLDNGALIAYPGSHVEPILPVQETSKPASTYALDPNARGHTVQVPEKYQPLSLPVKQGAAIFMHGHLIHRSGDNHSRRFRRAFLVDYIRAGTPFSPGRYAKRVRINVYEGP